MLLTELFRLVLHACNKNDLETINNTRFVTVVIIFMYVAITVIRVCYIVLKPNGLFRVVNLRGSVLTSCIPCLSGYALEETNYNNGLHYFLYCSAIIYSTSRR